MLCCLMQSWQKKALAVFPMLPCLSFGHHQNRMRRLSLSKWFRTFCSSMVMLQKYPEYVVSRTVGSNLAWHWKYQVPPMLRVHKRGSIFNAPLACMPPGTTKSSFALDRNWVGTNVRSRRVFSAGHTHAPNIHGAQPYARGDRRQAALAGTPSPAAPGGPSATTLGPIRG